MKSIMIKFALASLLAALTISCRPSENSESRQANTAPVRPVATATPPLITGSGKSGTNENAGSTQSVSGADAAAAQSELSAATRQLLSSTLRGESGEAAPLLADDYKHTRPDGTVEDKAQFLANLKPFPGYDGYIYDEFKVGSLVGDTAVVSFLAQIGTKDDKSFYSRYTWTFVKRAGKWLLQSSQNTEMTDKY
jgi:hypothetical protein